MPVFAQTTVCILIVPLLLFLEVWQFLADQLRPSVLPVGKSMRTTVSVDLPFLGNHKESSIHETTEHSTTKLVMRQLFFIHMQAAAHGYLTP